jgi:LCP family protein required for cell wall assembly
VDFVHPSITVVSLPRDLWVEIPGIEQASGYTHGKINQAYLFGAPGMGYYDGPAGGPGLLARTIQHNYGLAVDHYAAGNMQTFVQVIDALGGIDIELEQDVDGGELDGGEGLGYYPAGTHHLSGEQALKFARIRAKYGDLQRQENQSIVLRAVAKKLLTPAVFPKIPQLVESFQDSVLLDLSPEQIVQLTCLFSRAGQENLVFTQLPGELYTLGSIYSPIFGQFTSIVEADPAAIRDYLQKFAAGEWP